MDPAADFAARLTRSPSRDVYLQATSELLMKLFPSDRVAWYAMDAKVQVAEAMTFPELPTVPAHVILDLYGDDPLIVSYLQVRCETDVRRISDLVSDRELRKTRSYQEGLRLLGIARQFSIPTAQPGPVKVRAWALSRSMLDFTDTEMDLARALQPVLSLLDLAYSGDGGASGTRSSHDFALTSREEEILQILGKGLTGVAIGHLLGISPRTVSKHLEHAYAKLGRTKRIDALRMLKGD